MDSSISDETARSFECDVLVVGAGIAGLTAAISAAEFGATVTAITKGPFGRDGAASWMAGTGFQAALYSPDSPEVHARDTIRIGQYLSNQDLVLSLVNEIPECLGRLDRWGIHYLKANGRYVQIRLPGETYPRVPRMCRNGVVAGPEYRRLFPRQLRRLGVTTLGNIQALELLKRDGAVVGVLGLDTIDGHFVAIRAKAVILATGGFMGMYRFTATSPTLVGEGQSMAYHAGAQLRDVEFADFYTGCIKWPPLYAGELDWVTNLRYDLAGIVYNSRGEEFARHKKNSGLALPVIFQQEIQAGKGSPNGGVYLSFKHLPDNLIDHYFNSIGRPRWINTLRAIGVDIRHDAIEIAPAPLESIGGCLIDRTMQTTVPGLFAAGEVAGGAEGAFTMAGNPLPFYMAMGAIAGREAARFAKVDGKIVPDLPDLKLLEEEALRPIGNRSATAVPTVEVKRQLQQILDDHLHLLGRTQAGLEMALAKILEIRDGMDNWQVRTQTRRHNNEWMECLELRHMVTVCEMLARAALARQESRGLHFREDYPEPSDEWLCNLIIERAGDEMKITKAPISFSLMQPGGQ